MIPTRIMDELVEILRLMAAKKEQVENPLELYLDMAERIVKHVAALFEVKQDEVAILVLSRDKGHLRFIAPRRFSGLGTIPMTKRDSIAVTILGKGTGEAMNNVPMIRHVSFFESVKLRDRPAPIQKMVSVPIVEAGEALGVAQISRKGDNPAEAGPDFTRADVIKAQEVFQAVAPSLATARPEQF